MARAAQIVWARPNAVGRALWNPENEQYEVIQLGAAYRRESQLVRNHPDCFTTEYTPKRPGYGITVDENSRRRETVKIGDPYDDAV